MYRRTNTYYGNSMRKLDIPNYINGIDIYNSELLVKLDNIIELHRYTITRYEHRIDLISNDIYNNPDYGWIILYVNRMTIDDLVIGAELVFPSIEVLNSIINNL